MKTINDETRKLLDRLYNLRGPESVIFTGLNEEYNNAIELKQESEKKKVELDGTIQKLSEEEKALGSQGDRLKNILNTIKEEDFSILVERLNLDFNPSSIMDKINAALPGTIAGVVNERNRSEKELKEVEKQAEEASTKIEELTIRKDEAVANQNKLNEFFELALTGNSNITRDSISTLLEKFKFNKEDQKEAAKLLMFPEDALYDYEKNLESGEKNGKTISDVFQEAKESPVMEITEEPIKPFKADLIEPTVSPFEIVDEIAPIELNEEIQKEEARNLLKVCGLNVNDFTSQDIALVAQNYNKELIAQNVEYMNKIGMNKNLFSDNVEFLYDPELKLKVDTLISIGKDVEDIYLNPSVLLKYNALELTEAIDSLKNSGLDPAKVPLMAF